MANTRLSDLPEARALNCQTMREISALQVFLTFYKHGEPCR